MFWAIPRTKTRLDDFLALMIFSFAYNYDTPYFLNLFNFVRRQWVMDDWDLKLQMLFSIETTAI